MGSQNPAGKCVKRDVEKEKVDEGEGKRRPSREWAPPETVARYFPVYRIHIRRKYATSLEIYTIG